MRELKFAARALAKHPAAGGEHRSGEGDARGRMNRSGAQHKVAKP
jgi:hypothetical protein